MSKQGREPSFENVHWADNSAQRTIDTFPNEKVYTVASGITPSGYIHVGNFREVITTEMVRRALEDKGKKTKFIYSWDSYDAFRKVPSDVPAEWDKYLRLPNSEVPNPRGEGSYADEFMRTFENEVAVFNFPVVFQRQHELQTSGIYADSIKKVLNEKQKVIDALNKYRETPLSKNWMPIDIYDDESGKDDNEVLEFDGEYTLTYKTSDGKKKTVNFKEDPRVKLRWKADWPMRWNYFKVCFEPGGKDHSTPGSSYTVGSEIVKEIFGREPPVYTAYDWVRVKGQGGKISSSKGGALRVKDVLETYTPEMILFLFAGTRPNAEFDISFDMDVIKIYEDFDKLERVYYGLEEEKNPKKQANMRRIYELSHVNGTVIPKKIPFQPSFRHLTTVAQANNFDFEKVKAAFGKEIKTEFDEERVRQRLVCVKNWLETYAPEDMKFSINDKAPKVSAKDKKVVSDVLVAIDKSKDSKELFGEFRSIAENNEISVQDFFKLMYNIIVSKDKGPKLADFIFENKERIVKLLKSV